MLMKLIDQSSKSKEEALNIVTTNLASSINIEYRIFQSLEQIKDLVSPYIQFYDYFDLTENWTQVAFRNYFFTDVSSLIQMMNNWFIQNWKIWYVPK